MSIDFVKGDIFTKYNQSFVIVRKNKTEMSENIKSVKYKGENVTYGEYKSKLFGKRWIYNVIDLSLGLNEMLPHINSNCIRFLSIDISNSNLTNSDVFNIVSDAFKNNTIKIKIFNK